MYKPDNEMIDGYISLIGERILREPFKTNDALIRKYARGYRPQSIPRANLRNAYLASESILENFLANSLELVMKEVLSLFKEQNIDLKAVEYIDDDFIVQFALACKKVLSPDLNTNKFDVIFDYYKVKITHGQMEVLDYLLRTDIISKLELAEDYNKKIKLIEVEGKKLLAENQLEINALTAERIELINRIDSLDVEKKNLQVALNKRENEVEKQNEQIKQLRLSEEYMEDNLDESTTSFCVYGIYISHNDANFGEQFTVAYRIADIYKGHIVEKKEQESIFKYIKFKHSAQTKLNVRDSGIWKFDSQSGWAMEEIYDLTICEIVNPIEPIVYEKGQYNQIGAILGAGIEIPYSEIITKDFMLIIGETIEQYIVLITLKDQWESKNSKYVLLDYDKLFEVAYVKKDLIFRQTDAIYANDIEYKDRSFVVKDYINVFDKVDLIYSKEIIIKAINKAKNIYEVSNSERQKFKRLIEEILNTNDTRQKQLIERINALNSDEVEYREKLLLDSLENIENDFHVWDDAIYKLIQNHPLLYREFSTKIEEQWHKNYEQDLLKAKEALNSVKIELEEAKKSLNEIETKEFNARSEYQETLHQIDSMSENICNAVRIASEDAIKVVSENIILNALCKDQQSSNIGYNFLRAVGVKDLKECNDILENVILDNLDLFGFGENNNEYYSVSSIIVAALEANKIPIIISSKAALIANCISIAIYGATSNIVDVNSSIKNPIEVSTLRKQIASDGLLLIRDAIGGVKEEYIVGLLRRAEDLKNKIVLCCETKEELKYAPTWLHNYTIIIDMEDCLFTEKNDEQYEKCKAIEVRNENSAEIMKAKQLLDALKNSFNKNLAPLNNRYLVFNAFLKNEPDYIKALELLFRFDLIPLYTSLGMDSSNIKKCISSIRLRNFDNNNLIKQLEGVL